VLTQFARLYANEVPDGVFSADGNSPSKSLQKTAMARSALLSALHR
jgi:hypothetical protein